MRYFVNNMPDVMSGSPVTVNKAKWAQLAASLVDTLKKKMAAKLKNCDGGIYVGCPGVAYMLYYISQKQEFAAKKKVYLDLSMLYTKVSLEYLQQGGAQDPPSSFILGNAGINAVASLVLTAVGDVQRADMHVENYAAAAQHCRKINFFKNGSDELFVGRAGYLLGILNLHRKLGKKVLGDETVKLLCALTVESGRDYAKRHNTRSPLMYAYYGTEYLGAAHGLASILQVLMSFLDYLKSDPSAEHDIRLSVDYILSLKQPNFNYPAATDELTNPRPESEELVHWCHGAAGIVYLFARAYRVWGDEKYLAACLQCGELTWQKGLLRKGPGICHGIAGSGYVFLLLYRLTGDQRHLHRAQMFAEFLLTPEFQQEARTPDSPYSLFEGWAGTICFLADLCEPQKAEYPLFDAILD
ncbi:hypothetical protein ACJMK2_029593 [Sinanodonta woodiana]|uniref:LanC-like protein 3 n=1 Tax=Sinanodonta woodiana TaxID=1069815 RepID=A0ABD3XEN9_SINWO